ncbi:MAG: glutamine ABC transporter ATP-binding protein [Thermoprotei archaeon]|nr:MAG: glutamine ABC transporter ATP-binding protein [Thermoprotei archaeon]
MAFLEIIDLVAGYDDNIVIKGLSMKVEEGEKVVIIGPSGSGKSTLLKCIVRLVEPKSGKIFFRGVDVTSKDIDIRKIRQRTGFVFQNYNLFPHMTVLQNILLPLRVVKKMPKEEALKKALSVLEKVGMLEYKDAYPLQLSGGQQQRVAIARALAMDPELMLLDEPTSALDPELVDEVLDILRKVAKQGITLLIVTHELDFAEDVADRIIFMEDGKIVEEGPPHKLLYNPEKQRTKLFLRRILKRLHNKTINQEINSN